jgi:hypothetical protein
MAKEKKDKTNHVTVTRTGKKHYTPVEIAHKCTDDCIVYSYNSICATICLHDPKDDHDYYVSIPNDLILKMAKSLQTSPI